MSQLLRKLQYVFGTSGATAQFGKIGSDNAGSPENSKDLDEIQTYSGNYFANGLFAITNSAAEPARIEDFNSLFFLLTTQLKYLFQNGIPEWISTEDYYINTSYVQQGGIVYVSLSGSGGSPNTGNDPSISPTDWSKILDPTDFYFYDTYNYWKMTSGLHVTSLLLGEDEVSSGITSSLIVKTTSNGSVYIGDQITASKVSSLRLTSYYNGYIDFSANSYLDGSTLKRAQQGSGASIRMINTQGLSTDGDIIFYSWTNSTAGSTITPFETARLTGSNGNWYTYGMWTTSSRYNDEPTPTRSANYFKIITSGSRVCSLASGSDGGFGVYANAYLSSSNVSTRGDSTIASSFYYHSYTQLDMYYVASGGGTITWGDPIVRFSLSGNNSYIYSGNVGIGTRTPSAKLHVYDSYNGTHPGLKIENASNGSSAYTDLNLINDTAYICYIALTSSTNTAFDGANKIYIGSSSNTSMTFLTNNTQRLRILADGKVGIGNTNISYVYGGALTLVGDGSVNAFSGTLRIINTATSDRWSSITLGITENSVAGSNNLYLIGRGSSSILSGRAMTFHIPSLADWGGSGSTPEFRFYSTSNDLLMSLTATSGNMYLKGELDVGNLIKPGGGIESTGVEEALRTRILEIGTWVCYVGTGSYTKSVAHSLSISQIRSIKVLMLNDSETTLHPLDFNNNTSSGDHVSGEFYADATYIQMRVTPGEKFDSSSYQSDGVNRGFIEITYAL